MDLYGKGLLRYFEGQKRLKFILHNNIGGVEKLPVSVYFKSKLDQLESKAIDLCVGEVLDVGAGTGRHSEVLTQKGLKVKSIDTCQEAVFIMKSKGLDAELLDVFSLSEEKKYDTLFLMMNGIGLAGTLKNIPQLLNKLKALLKPDGQIVFDSSDIAHLFGEAPIPLDRYYGEVKFRFDLKKEKGEWLDWVYVDPVQMNFLAEKAGFRMQILYTDQLDQYLAKLTLA